MSDQAEETTESGSKPVYLGMFTGSGTGAPSSVALTGLGLALIWALGFGVWALMSGEVSASPVNVGLVVLVCFLPLCLAGFGYYISGSLGQMRTQAEELDLAVKSLRQALVVQKQSGVIERASGAEQKLNEIASTLRKTEAKLALFASAAQAAPVAAPVENSASSEQVVPSPQATLGFEPDGVQTGALPNSDLIRALNFPDDPDDKVGFEALRRALRDRGASEVIQAAQDVLTLLSQDGIYMDDLTPDRARPEIWRRFAQGERGKTVAILGGIRDRSALALTAGRMRQDTIFRDSVHHFLRRFDRALVEFEKTASDLEIVSLTDTRSARAFMLLGRVTGTFS